MSKETISIKTLSEIVPLYNSIQNVYECSEEPCRNCDFKSFGPSCQAMRAAVKLQSTVHNIVKTELRNFCNDFINALSETDETIYKHDFLLFTMDSIMKKYLEENNKK